MLVETSFYHILYRVYSTASGLGLPFQTQPDIGMLHMVQGPSVCYWMCWAWKIHTRHDQSFIYGYRSRKPITPWTSRIRVGFRVRYRIGAIPRILSRYGSRSLLFGLYTNHSVFSTNKEKPFYRCLRGNMPPRRSHKKSRNGCDRCKQRRVKVGRSDLSSFISPYD
jgi:hypothetical protein